MYISAIVILIVMWNPYWRTIG